MWGHRLLKHYFITNVNQGTVLCGDSPLNCNLSGCLAIYLPYGKCDILSFYSSAI